MSADQAMFLIIRGGNAIADGPVSSAGLARAMERVRIGGFAHLPEPPAPVES